MRTVDVMRSGGGGEAEGDGVGGGGGFEGDGASEFQLRGEGAVRILNARVGARGGDVAEGEPHHDDASGFARRFPLAVYLSSVNKIDEDGAARKADLRHVRADFHPVVVQPHIGLIGISAVRTE